MPHPRVKRQAPPLWFGCALVAWCRLLLRNRGAIPLAKWPLVFLITLVSVAHTVLRLLQTLLFDRRVARTPIRQGPIFILGHWRAGTTLLHELLACDPRHAVPTTYQCFVPHHFLLTESWLPRFLRRFFPERRPMDNMAAGWERPQEDEFALLLLGEPSPYERIGFPANPQAGAGALDLRGLPAAVTRRWQRVFYRFVQQLTYAHPDKRLVLKSPPHTCRLPILLDLFPDARFVHIMRDPYILYPSTLHLWRVLTSTHALQRPTWEHLPEYILQTFVAFYTRLEEARPLVPPGRLYELRYEDLVQAPLEQLATLYESLDLGDFSLARPRVEAYLAAAGRYETNRYFLTDEERQLVTTRWAAVLQQYGYGT